MALSKSDHLHQVRLIFDHAGRLVRADASMRQTVIDDGAVISEKDQPAENLPLEVFDKVSTDIRMAVAAGQAAAATARAEQEKQRVAAAKADADSLERLDHSGKEIAARQKNKRG